MRRPAVKSWPREDVDREDVDREDVDHGQGDGETDGPEAGHDPEIPPADEAVYDTGQESQIPPLQTVPARKQGGGIVSLIIIAILGMIIGFVAVMLM